MHVLDFRTHRLVIRFHRDYRFCTDMRNHVWSIPYFLSLAGYGGKLFCTKKKVELALGFAVQKESAIILGTFHDVNM